MSITLTRVTLTPNDLKKIKPGPIRHSELPPALVDRLRAIWPTLKPLTTWSPTCEQWELGFMRDMNPEREVAVWEWMAAELTKFKRRHPYASHKRQQREFGKLLRESFNRAPLVFVKAA